MSRWLDPLIDVWSSALKIVRPAKHASKRLLVDEILSLQIVITATIGALAILGLYWGGQWVLQDNYSRWAMQWTEELNELGSPLYMFNDTDAAFRLESFIDKYPEISRVSYFESDGSVMHAIYNGAGDGGEQAPIDADKIDELSALVRSDVPYLVETSYLNARVFRILAPVWTESIAGDGLFNFDFVQEPGSSQIKLVGFVGLELDFSLFHNQLLSNIKIAIVVLLAMLLLSGFIGRRQLARALTAISDLHDPITELAKGNMNVEFKPSAHREISEIVEALEATVSALCERDARLLHLANHDSLTGLFNRRRLVEELKKEIDNVITNESSGALLFIDLDQFKYVNDTCGHPAGDRLIKKVAEQLESTVGQMGIVARFGGDEFAVLLHSVRKREAENIANEILLDMRQLAHIEGDKVLHVHCSIGITTIQSDKFDHDELIAHADIACREAKESGRNRHQFYSLSEHEANKIVADVGWVGKLRDAIDNDKFRLMFQPIVEIATGRITHHEVLLRLVGDNGKLVSPDAFLPAAVRFGLMAEIDTWIVEHAIQILASFREAQPDLRFSLNLSANAFEVDDLTGFVRSTLEKNNVPAGAVIFEITESLAVRHLNYVEHQIGTLRELGCELALDDFGTGYSSFGYLQKLSVDYIKIDGCFIRDLANNPVDQKMVRLIGEIGQEAGMRTVAEYVQDAPTLALLAELGIDSAQGYFIGRPTAIPTTKSMPIPISFRKTGSTRP